MIEVQGNGNIISKEVNVSSFIRLHLMAAGTIELYQSDDEKVIIETDENLLGYFEIQNSGRTLYISTEGKFRKPKFTSCIIKVHLRNIDTLYVRGDNSNVTCKNRLTSSFPIEVKCQSESSVSLDINVPALKILCQSVGKITLKGNCNNLNIKNQGEGDFDSTELLVEELYIKNMSSGNVKIAATKLIEINQLGDGYVHYSGTAVLKDIRKMGSGEVKHV